MRVEPESRQSGTLHVAAEIRAGDDLRIGVSAFRTLSGPVP